MLGRSFLISAFKRLPALEILAFVDIPYWDVGVIDSLAGQPSLCQSLKTIAFHNCTFTPEEMRVFEGVVEKRKGSAAAPLHRVVFVSSIGPLPDYTVIQRLRQHVPCIDVRVDDRLPDLS